tara:strand:- start:46008 stop:47489 length:1482 start_codon:yes stop_codon:yes gene_type:complete
MISGSDWSIAHIRNAIGSGDILARDICEIYLNRIQTVDKELNSFTTVLRDQALIQAEEIDRKQNSWETYPLFGVPITVKDVICTKDSLTSAGSRMLADYRPPYDATVIKLLRDSGAILLGKTNCDEFAMGSSTEYSYHGPTQNPWKKTHIPGGSSGGAAAAVAARLAPVSIASDTGGSIRQPAAFCGVVGLKPTYGRVSRYGLLAFASSLDQIGPITLSVEDAAIVFQVISGFDPNDATSSKQSPIDDSNLFSGNAHKIRIGVPRSILEKGINPEVTKAFNKAIAILSEQGATIVDIDLPYTEHAVPVYYLIATAEASSNLARYDGVRFGYRANPDGPKVNLETMYSRTRNHGFGDEVKRRIMLGTYALSAGYYDDYYAKAQQVRQLIRHEYNRVLSDVDAIAMPTTPTPAFELGEHVDDPLSMYLGDIFTVSANLTGLPAISLPAGLTKQHLPIGFQLIGRAFDETTLFRVAHTFEMNTEWKNKRPPACLDT